MQGQCKDSMNSEGTAGMLMRAKVLTAPDDDMGDGIRAAGPNPRLCVQVAAAQNAYYPAAFSVGQGVHTCVRWVGGCAVAWVRVEEVGTVRGRLYPKP